MLPGHVFGLSQGQFIREEEGGGAHLPGRMEEEGSKPPQPGSPFFVQTRPISSSAWNTPIYSSTVRGVGGEEFCRGNYP